jgi:hypothetical protein
MATDDGPSPGCPPGSRKLQDSVPAPSTAPPFPFGTTSDWRLDPSFPGGVQVATQRDPGRLVALLPARHHGLSRRRGLHTPVGTSIAPSVSAGLRHRLPPFEVRK